MKRFGEAGWRYPLGLSRSRAELFGKPNVGAEYVGRERYVHTADRCPVCGAPAGSVHHLCPRGTARSIEIVGPDGPTLLRSSLVALCGSGTTGCHGRMHSRELEVEWEWYRPAYEAMWWDGLLLASVEPHSNDLYRYGCWAIRDRDTHSVLRIRRGM